MHLCVCAYLCVPGLIYASTKIKLLKSYHCYWIPFHRIPGVVLVVFMSSLAAPWVVLMTACDAVRDTWRLDFSTGDPRDPVVSLLILNLLPCTKTPDRGCECIYIYSSEYLNLIFFIEEVILCLTMFLDVILKISCLCWFYWSFTCTLSEIINKRCLINQIISLWHRDFYYKWFHRK